MGQSTCYLEDMGKQTLKPVARDFVQARSPTGWGCDHEEKYMHSQWEQGLYVIDGERSLVKGWLVSSFKAMNKHIINRYRV